MFARLSRRLLPATPPARWRFAGLAVLMCGGTTAAVTWATSEPAPAAAVPLSRLKAQELALERFGGRFAVEAAKFDDWFAGLWNGSALPRTLLVLTIAVALACFWIARLADDPPKRR